MHPESEKEKEQKSRAIKRRDDPSPTTYKVAEALEKASGSKF